MATIRHHVRIDAPADSVWALITDPVAITTWADGLDACTFDGTSRTITAMGTEIVEEIVTNDSDLRRFQYSITGGPMPVEYHLATIDVIEDGETSLLIYAAEIKPDSFKDFMDGLLGGLAQQLKAAAEK
ncbi:MAG: SRPBCC family protein [Acidimicrobiia bacterium]|nr:SRPBCC family protein [Acidimicrobiia bacterium]